MGFATNIIALSLMLGVLTLNPLGQCALADQLSFDEQPVEVRDLDEVSKSHSADSITLSDRAIVPSESASTSAVEDRVSIYNKIADSAKSIFDLAKVNRWSEATESFTALEKTAQTLKANPEINKTDIAKLNSWIIPLGNLIAAKQPLAMDTANQLAMVASQLTIQPNSKTPVEVAMLDYYGRELEIWSTRGNTVKLKDIANKIIHIWSDLRPSVQSKSSTVHVLPIDDTLISLLGDAESSDEYKLLSAPLLAEVNIFQQLLLQE